MCRKRKNDTTADMSNQRNARQKHCKLPAQPRSFYLESSRVFELETMRRAKIFSFNLRLTQSIFFERRFDETCKHENNIATDVFWFFLFEVRNSKKTNLDHSNMKRHRRLNSTKTTNARRPFAECSQAYFRT